MLLSPILSRKQYDKGNKLNLKFQDGKKLKGFPLVDNPNQMILLGSVQRFELISAIEKHIGKDRQDQYNKYCQRPKIGLNHL